jgi:hypothetical protein
MTRSLWSAVLLGAAAATSAGQDEPYYNSYKGKTPPELVSEKEHWLNSKKPLTLEKLRGRVVWLEFSFID